jgi:dimethylamine monooxygenase subunit A
MTSDDPDLTALPDEDFRFSLGIREGDAAEFFGPSADRKELLAERRRWLREDPTRYVAAGASAGPTLNEVELLAGGWGCGPSPAAGDQLGRLIELGQQLEPDLVLLAPGADGRMAVVAGCVCFPSYWRLTDKLGLPVDGVHGPVPGLNASLGTAINKYLARMKRGSCWLRANWGLAATPERNEHPDRHARRLEMPVDFERIWIRREDQAILSLPASGGVLFGIRVVVQPLAELARSPEKAERLGRALRTMPLAVLHYKGLSGVREELIAFLDAAASS